MNFSDYRQSIFHLSCERILTIACSLFIFSLWKNCSNRRRAMYYSSAKESYQLHPIYLYLVTEWITQITNNLCERILTITSNLFISSHKQSHVKELHPIYLYLVSEWIAQIILAAIAIIDIYATLCLYLHLRIKSFCSSPGYVVFILFCFWTIIDSWFK